jgi:hypothetical protein
MGGRLQRELTWRTKWSISLEIGTRSTAAGMSARHMAKGETPSLREPRKEMGPGGESSCCDLGEIRRGAAPDAMPQPPARERRDAGEHQKSGGRFGHGTADVLVISIAAIIVVMMPLAFALVHVPGRRPTREAAPEIRMIFVSGKR